MSRLIAASRYLVIVPALGAFLAATAVWFYGVAEIIQQIRSSLREPISSSGAKAFALTMIEGVDLFLLGTVMYIIALGLYELFIDDTLALPAWLAIHNLDDLKNKLTGVIIPILGVLFLGQVITWDGQRNLLPYGLSVAVIIVALTYFLGLRGKKPGQ